MTSPDTDEQQHHDPNSDESDQIQWQWRFMSHNAKEHFLQELECSVARHNTSLIDLGGQMEELRKQVVSHVQLQQKDSASDASVSASPSPGGALEQMQMALDNEKARNDQLEKRLSMLEHSLGGSNANADKDGDNADKPTAIQ